ncbi:MAG TPA: histidinol dehydrogenase [Microbacteriaceae bacterium]|nr:histidinol dehydrogenase [Microbacteriaceae bacterium]
MFSTLDLRGRATTPAELLALVPRAETDVADASAAAAALIDDVRARGGEALRNHSERFDGLRPDRIRVPEDDIATAVDALDPALREAVEETIARVRAASAAQVPPARFTELAPGARVEQRWVPVDRVGVYVPGGKAIYPSSVVMNVVPAQVAGVSSIALASPVQREHGGVHPVVLAVAGLLGVTEVYAMGGASAIGAFAHGVPDIGLAPVSVVTGPGNVYVAAAKRVVSGIVGTDAEAGPTDILVIADASANPRWVAADLLSQAEHDELASAVLVTTDPSWAELVTAELERQVAETTHVDRVVAALNGPQSKLVLVDSLDQAVAFANAYAPEHLEVVVADPEPLLARLGNAGVVFVGPHAPVALGDYMAGSNHVLPTGGQARYRAGLSAATFLKAQQLVRYDREGLEPLRERIETFAAAEGLPAHGAAVTIRFEE